MLSRKMCHAKLAPQLCRSQMEMLQQEGSSPLANKYVVVFSTSCHYLGVQQLVHGCEARRGVSPNNKHRQPVWSRCTSHTPCLCMHSLSARSLQGNLARSRPFEPSRLPVARTRAYPRSVGGTPGPTGDTTAPPGELRLVATCYDGAILFVGGVAIY